MKQKFPTKQKTERQIFPMNVERRKSVFTSTSFSTGGDGSGCSICLDGFSSPRQLPCLHSFCEHCLQDYITKKASSTDKTFVEFMCPVCRALTSPANKEKPVREWASLFPNSPFPLVQKSRVERSCEVCSNSSDSYSNLAKKFCTVCEEFMCDNCVAYHQKMKMTKGHQIITTDDLETNPENRIRFREGFGCHEHDNEDIKFYCNIHETACCSTCSFLHHKSCPDVLELKQSLPGLLEEMNTQKIMEQMQKLEAHLKVFMEANESNISILDSHVNNISVEIGNVRRKLNTLLDDIEKMVKLEGTRIYKEWVIRKEEQNHQCQSLISAIRNSQALVETVGQYGSDTQKFLVNSKTMKQLYSYSDRIRETFEKVDSIKIRLELDSNMEALLSKDALGLVKLACQEETKDLQCSCLMIPLQQQTMELSRVIDVDRPGLISPLYFGIVHLPNRYIVLADAKNKTCCLYDSSYNFIASHTLPGNPAGMCLIGGNEVAVAMSDMKSVQFLSLRDRSIIDTGTVSTKYNCFGVGTVSLEEILVSGHCGARGGSCKCYWSVINKNGNVKLHYEFDCQRTYNAYAALDMSKSRVYISVSGGNAVYCYDLTVGKQYFVYLSSNLKYPTGVAVDRDDNIYIVGNISNNIHKLSPKGVVLQVITSGVPDKPTGIIFSDSRDHFIITNTGRMCKKLHYFGYKKYMS
ncbi:hypothetical protein CHS0354_035556 [Potamilus streckersoni]|uniref:Uncharacterized protein n=1 Tax=Potamilus streckersoni TaxID=2493646 RepID=A0AAE0VJE1_9BIVA|nr:hypothetical protein CHS0354_035556 [Potamilus streckersoni]